jgi:hypothetical protein
LDYSGIYPRTTVILVEVYIIFIYSTAALGAYVQLICSLIFLLWLKHNATNVCLICCQASTLVIEQLLDSLANHLDKEDFEYVERLYLQAFKLELDFFSAQPNCDCPLLPFIKSQTSDSRSSYLLMSDFDLTCTMTDSCTVLADATIRNASKHGEKHHSSIKQTWDFLKKSYGTQYNNIIHLLEDAG